MINRIAIFVVVLGALLSTSCSRDLPSAKLSLTIPFGSDQGNLSVNDKLDIVIINVHIPGQGPLVRQFKFEGQNISLGQDLTLEITDIPRGTGYLIQFLGVYENDQNGAMKFYYGDALADATTAEFPVEITAENFAQSDKFIRFAGRYISGTSPVEYGPTGYLLAQFQPPNNKPRMTVERMPIVNGWFSAFSTDTVNAPFRYVLAETGEVLFDNLSSASPVFSGLGSERMKVIKPASARREGGGSIRMSPEMYLYLGYWGVGSGHNVCFVGTDEAVMGHYTDGTLTTPLDFIGAGSATSADVRVAGGGTSETYNVYVGAGSTCAGAGLASGQSLLFHHTHAGDEEGFSGFRVPFQAVRPFYEYPTYLSGTFQPSPTPKWTLQWKFLPQAAASLSGVEIFYKYSTTSDSGSGGERNCSELQGRGFIPAGSVTGGAESFDFVNAGLTNANYYNYRFAACAYRTLATGIRQYLGSYIESQCLTGDCSGLGHFGWAKAGSASTVSTTTPFSSRGGVSQRVTNVPSVADAYTTLTVGTSTDFVAGQEVMVLIQGASGTSPCGTENGSSLDFGRYAFARVLGASGTTLKISRGTFLDTIATANLNSAATSGTFCYVQVVKVPHFRNLTLSSGGEVTTSAFDYGVNGGGVVALRVNGILDLGGGANSIRVDGKGYPGGSNTIPHGGGQRQTAWNSPTSHMGGNDSGGGGGLGNGGNGGAANGGLGVTNSNGNLRLLFGGGGTSVGPTGNGNGGGLIFVMAERTTSAGGALNAAGGAGWASGGAGGGGGTVALITRQLTGTGINFNSPGGNAVGGSGNWGGGGGGYTFAMACQNSVTSTGQNIAGGAGFGTGTPGMSVAHSVYASTSNFWFCNN